MYGYPRLTLTLKQPTNLKVGPKLVYQLMQELDIKSHMIKKTNKPQTHTDYEQRPNLRTCLDTLTFDLILVKLDQKQEFLIH
ncbi:transposase, partial [Lactiplantibacillus plantarum]|nr:transposase [Lactiplantibacillus plantarum]